MKEGAAPTPVADSGAGVRLKLITVIVIAAAVRIGALLITDPQLASDALVYHKLADSLADTGTFALDGGLMAYRPPGYPAFLAAVTVVTGSSILGVRIVQVLVDIVTCLLVFRVTRRFSSHSAALAASGLYAVYLPAVLYSQVHLSETLFSMTLLLLVDHLSEHGWDSDRVLFSGLLIGLCAYIKPVVAAFPLALLVHDLTGGTQVGRSIRRSVLLLLMTCLVMSPWIVRNRLAVGATLFTTNGGVNFWIGNNPGATGGFKMPPGNDLFDGTGEVRRNARAFREATRFITEHPLEALKLLPSKFFFLISSESTILLYHYGGMNPGSVQPGTYAHRYLSVPLTSLILVNGSYYLLLLLSLPAMFLGGRVSRTGPRRLLLTLLLFWVVVHLLFFGSNRFHEPMMPVCAVFAGISLASRTQLREDPSCRAVTLLLLTALGFLVLWTAEWVLLSLK